MPATDRFSLILFDLGKVVLPFNIRIATQAFAKECSLPSEEIVRRVMGNSLDWDFETGKISPEEFYEEVERRIGLNVTYDRFVELWNDIFSENQKVSEMVRRLKEKYLVAIISNTNKLHFDFAYRKFPIVREVGHFILSYQLGVRKPDPKIYQIALERFHVTPQKTIYIDDLEPFVNKARTLGLYGVHFKDENQLEVECRTLNLF